MKKKLFIVVGIICVVLGTIGVFLPVLPTTPFLLLASYCFSRSSQKFNEKLLNNKFIGRYIRDYVENKTMRLRDKITTLVILWAGIISTIIFTHLKWYVDVILLVVAVSVSIHIILIGRKKKDGKAEIKI